MEVIDIAPGGVGVGSGTGGSGVGSGTGGSSRADIA